MNDIMDVVKGYGITSDGYLRMDFRNGAMLVLVPHEPSKNTLDVLLYHSGELQAIAGIENPEKNETVFWGDIRQSELADHWAYALKLGTMIQMAYQNKKLRKTGDWGDTGFKRIWEISQRGWPTKLSLLTEKLPKAEKMPERFVEILIKVTKNLPDKSDC